MTSPRWESRLPEKPAAVRPQRCAHLCHRSTLPPWFLPHHAYTHTPAPRINADIQPRDRPVPSEQRGWADTDSRRPRCRELPVRGRAEQGRTRLTLAWVYQGERQEWLRSDARYLGRTGAV